MMTGMILIDFRKSFDTLNHDVLLQKLYGICFPKATVNWCKSYLSSRSFRINLRNNCFRHASISCGVPQGSILGTLLFLIYVNNMSQAVKCNLFLYAHESCLACQNKDINEIQKEWNKDFLLYGIGLWTIS